MQTGVLLQYTPVAVQRGIPLREVMLLIYYHLRLLNWRLFLFLFLGFFGSGVLLWFQLRLDSPDNLSSATQLSRFVMEAGSGLLAGALASSLIVDDLALEAMIATRTGIYWVTIWRYLLTTLIVLLGSALYLAWSLGNGISYASQQSPLFLLLVWLVPVLIMSMLGLFSSLLTRNATLGMAIAAIPLLGALFLNRYLLPIEQTHPFLIPYTSWGHDADDWWINRFTLLSISLILALGTWWLLGREERLIKDSR